MGAAIRPATPADTPAVLGLLREARLVLEGLAASGAGVIVAEARGRVVGAVARERHGPDALLRSLVVAPAWRGSGLGHRLVEALLEQARRAGDRRIYLLTETAEPFFAARGFQRVPRADAPPAVAASHEFRVACPAGAAFMVRDVA